MKLKGFYIEKLGCFWPTTNLPIRVEYDKENTYKMNYEHGCFHISRNQLNKNYKLASNRLLRERVKKLNEKLLIYLPK